MPLIANIRETSIEQRVARGLGDQDFFVLTSPDAGPFVLEKRRRVCPSIRLFRKPMRHMARARLPTLRCSENAFSLPAATSASARCAVAISFSFVASKSGCVTATGQNSQNEEISHIRPRTQADNVNLPEAIEMLRVQRERVRSNRRSCVRTKCSISLKSGGKAMNISRRGATPLRSELTTSN